MTFILSFAAGFAGDVWTSADRLSPLSAAKSLINEAPGTPELLHLNVEPDLSWVFDIFSASVLQECVDIDECVDLPDACVSNSVCINTVVSSPLKSSKAELCWPETEF